MGALALAKTTLTSAVAKDGTVTLSYPAGTNQASLTGSTGGLVSINDGASGTYKQGSSGFTVAFSTSITITNKSDVTWPAGATLDASFGQTDISGSYNMTAPKQLQDKVAELAAA